MKHARDMVRGAPLRIALIATVAFALAYVLVAGAALYTVQVEGMASIDVSLQQQRTLLTYQLAHGPGALLRLNSEQVGWAGVEGGPARPLSASTPPVAPPAIAMDSPQTEIIDGVPYRLIRFDVQASVGGTPVSWLMLGDDLSGTYARTARLAFGAAVIGPFALAMVFLAAWWIGRSAAAPAVRARERELAFTADASHELRTPLQVIEAESSLALLRERPATAYRETIERISGESKRLRSIVDDLLWLARFEEEDRKQGAPSPVDLAEIVRTTDERFSSVAARRGIVLEGHVVPSSAPLVVLGSVEWLERLTGVLVDNAIRYTPDGGHIDLWAASRSGRIVLGVADTGPGITAEEAQYIFERFHRASSKPGGAGLGLAIADSVVRSTGGQWAVGRSPSLGGAQFEVSWPAPRTQRSLPAPEPHPSHI